MWVLIVPFLWLARPTAVTLVSGGAMVVCGLAIRAWAAGQLQKNKQLTVSGPYSYTRNPLYLGSFIIGVGVTTAGGLPIFMLIFLVFFVVVYWRTMDQERERLADQFGEPYRQYRQSVPLFFPRLRPYRPAPNLGQAATRFSMERYLRNKEWEAALGAVLGLGFLTARAAGVF